MYCYFMSSVKGRVITENTKRKISNSLKNEKHFAWKETPTYGIVHYWLRKNFVKKNICEHCGIYKKCDWALKKEKKYERNRNNFIELCRSCHYKYDHQNKLRIKKPVCLDCNTELKDWYSKRCYSHAQKNRFKNISSNT